MQAVRDSTQTATPGQHTRPSRCQAYPFSGKKTLLYGQNNPVDFNLRRNNQHLVSKIVNDDPIARRPNRRISERADRNTVDGSGDAVTRRRCPIALGDIYQSHVIGKTRIHQRQNRTELS